MKNPGYLRILTSFFILFLISCSPSGSLMATSLYYTEAAWTIPPTYTLYPTFTKQPALIQEVTRIEVITDTDTPVPTATGVQFNTWFSNGPIISGEFTDVYFFDALAVDPKTPSTVYGGGYIIGLYKSIDGGLDWKKADTGMPDSSDIEALLIDPLNPMIIFAGTFEGIYESRDGGGKWWKVIDGDASALAIDPVIFNTMYAGIDFTIYKSTSSGRIWNPISIDFPTHFYINSLAIDPITPTTIYAGCSEYWGSYNSNGLILKSTNGGEEWHKLTSIIKGDESISIVIDPGTPTTIFAGMRGGVIKSTNSGKDWVYMNEGLTNLWVEALVIDPSKTNTLYAGTQGGGVFKSINGGISWKPFNIGLPPREEIFSLAIDPTNPNILYAGSDEGIFIIHQSSSY